jgi:hypothetical protein
VFAEMRLTQEQIDTRMGMFDDIDAILDGRLLVPPNWGGFPGGAPLKDGVDVRNTLETSDPLYPVWFLDGGFYKREGPVCSPERWQQITKTFGQAFVLGSFLVI